MKSIFLSILLVGFLGTKTESFKDEQLTYPRVRQAYKDKEGIVKQSLKTAGIDINKMEICIRAFKEEKELQVWARNNEDAAFKLVRIFYFCASSGTLGPKRKMGDNQIPEGFYQIIRFNPSSAFYLSLGIDYPNASDKVLGVKGKLGGDIFIHGDCVTIGCIPITDDKIKELYIYCVESKNNGNPIHVTIYPAKLTEQKYMQLKNEYKNQPNQLSLWEDLYKEYSSFEANKKLCRISFLANGRHYIQ
jgi:murein L,D-transpeptidase YafK